MNENLALNQSVVSEVKKMLENIDNIIVKFDLFSAIVEHQC